MGRGGRTKSGGSTLAAGRGATTFEKYETGIDIDANPQPDKRDPRIGGYKTISADEAYARLEEIKKAEPHRITRGLDLTDFDQVHSLVIPEVREKELSEYLAAKAAEREAELEELGVKNIGAYNTSSPTAKEAGAQYDIHAENIALGDQFEIADGEKARLPGGQFILGPCLVEVVEGNTFVLNKETGERESGLAVRVSTPLGQGISLLKDPFTDEEAGAVDADALREEWIAARARIICDNTEGKAPLTAERAAEIISNNPSYYGFEGERFSAEGQEAYNIFAEKAARELVDKTKNDRALTKEEARRVAEQEYEEVKPRHALTLTLLPDGRLHSNTPMQPEQNINTANGISPNPLVWGPRYLDFGENPEIS